MPLDFYSGVFLRPRIFRRSTPPPFVKSLSTCSCDSKGIDHAVKLSPQTAHCVIALSIVCCLAFVFSSASLFYSSFPKNLSSFCLTTTSVLNPKISYEIHVLSYMKCKVHFSRIGINSTNRKEIPTFRRNAVCTIDKAGVIPGAIKAVPPVCPSVCLSVGGTGYPIVDLSIPRGSRYQDHKMMTE